MDNASNSMDKNNTESSHFHIKNRLWCLSYKKFLVVFFSFYYVSLCMWWIKSVEDLCEIYDYDYKQSTIETAQLEKNQTKIDFLWQMMIMMMILSSLSTNYECNRMKKDQWLAFFPIETIIS